MQFIDTRGGIYPWSISTKETTTTTITTNSSKVSHHFIHYWSRGEIEKSRLQSIPYLLIFLLFSFSFSCRMTVVYDASSKRDYDSADGNDLFRSTNVSHFLQRSCESERKSRSFPAKKVREEKRGGYSAHVPISSLLVL